MLNDETYSWDGLHSLGTWIGISEMVPMWLVKKSERDFWSESRQEQCIRTWYPLDVSVWWNWSIEFGACTICWTNSDFQLWNFALCPLYYWKTEDEWIPTPECVDANTNTRVSQEPMQKVWKLVLGKTQYAHCHCKRGWMELKDERPSNRRSWRVQAQSTNVKMTMWSTICVNLRTSLTEFHSVLFSEADFAFVIHSPFCPVPLRLHRPPTISRLLCFPSLTQHPCLILQLHPLYQNFLLFLLM